MKVEEVRREMENARKRAVQIHDREVPVRLSDLYTLEHDLWRGVLAILEALPSNYGKSPLDSLPLTVNEWRKVWDLPLPDSDQLADELVRIHSKSLRRLWAIEEAARVFEVWIGDRTFRKVIREPGSSKVFESMLGRIRDALGPRSGGR